jgi:PHD/YefM family antitoxin component YafN of YafNO toxin-antitoxin module
MNTIISVNQARDHLGQLIQEAHYLGKPFVLTRGKKPMAAIIGTQEFSRILELIETYDPALADTLAMMTNPEVEELLKQGDAAIQKGDMVPFDERMLQVTEDEK